MRIRVVDVESGTYAPRASGIRRMVDARDLAAQTFGGVVEISIAEDARTTDVEIMLTSLPAAGCDYSVLRDSIRVTRGENALDQVLELEAVDTTLFTTSGERRLSWSGELAKGAIFGLDVALFQTSVPTGTRVSHKWVARAVESDTVDPDDIGRAQGELRFQCLAHGSRADVVTVPLDHAEIEVQVVAVW